MMGRALTALAPDPAVSGKQYTDGHAVGRGEARCPSRNFLVGTGPYGDGDSSGALVGAAGDPCA